LETFSAKGHAVRALDIMTRPVYTVRDTDGVDQIGALLAEQAVTAAPVLNKDGEVVGIVSEGDLLRHQAGVSGGAGHPATAAQLMSRQVVTISAYAPVSEVAATMLDRAVHSVPVVEDRQLVGIVSRADLLRTLVCDDALIQREVQHRLDEYAGQPRWYVHVHDGDVLVGGQFDDDAERAVVSVLARTVDGVHQVVVSQPGGEVGACG
jgi:CBS domain-containing protein